MRRKSSVIAMVVALLAVPLLADDVLYRYEGDVLPHDPSAGWIVGNLCEGFCAESIENGHFVLTWIDGGDLANYGYRIAEPPDAPPPRCGSSGASDRASPSVESSTPATDGFP